MAATDQRDHKSVVYELFILLISLLSLANLAIAFLSFTFVKIPSTTGDVVVLIDAVLTAVFFVDFVFRLLTAPSRSTYFFHGDGWLDLIAAFPVLRILRIVRVVEIVRWLRHMGFQWVADQLSEKRAAATFLFTIWLTIVVVEAAGALIFTAESGDPSANIKTAGDAIWWGLVTITTVGYGDRYPVTAEGRIIGVILLFAGIALFSVLTGFIANSFLTPRRHVKSRRAAPGDSRAAIATLRDLLAEQDQRTEQLRNRLDELELALTRSSDMPPDAEVSSVTTPRS